MKKTIIFSLSIFLLLLNSFLRSGAEDPSPVRDIDGKKLRASKQYYILPVMRGSGGGTTLGSPVNSSGTCPRNVVQAPSAFELGDPVTFTPVNPEKEVISVSTDLNIRFHALTFCIESNVWRLDYAEEIGQYFVATNGVGGNPGIETIDNWVKIEAYETDYRWYNLRFCPTVCNSCRSICRDVGIYDDPDFTRRLTLGDVPFLVMFRKARRFSSNKNNY